MFIKVRDRNKTFIEIVNRTNAVTTGRPNDVGYGLCSCFYVYLLSLNDNDPKDPEGYC